MIGDALAFRDTAFPDRGWQLSELLEPRWSATVSGETGVQFLVVLGPARLMESSEEKGGYIPALAGAESSKQTTELTAAIFDLRTADLVSYVRAEATGNFASVTWVVVSAMKVPMTATSAFNGFGEAIAKRVGPGSKIAIVSAEGQPEPFQTSTSP